MRKLLNDVGLIVALALLWGLCGFVLGAVLETFFVTGYPLAFIVTALNMIAGLVGLLIVTHDPYARHIFYDGPRANEPGMPIIGCLWAIPIALLMMLIPIWILSRLLSK